MLLQASGQHAEGSNELVCPTGSEPSHIPSALEVLLDGLASAYILSPPWALGSKDAPPASSFSLPRTPPLVPWMPLPRPLRGGGSW